MAMEEVVQSNALAEYGIMIAKMIIVAIMGSGAYFVKRAMSQHDADITEIKKLIPKVVSLDEQAMTAKTDIVEIQDNVKELRAQQYENHKELTDRISTQVENIKTKLNEVQLETARSEEKLDFILDWVKQQMAKDS